MPVIQGGRWQRQLQKFFGIKGEVVASELAPEIYATYNLVAGIEDDILEGWRHFSFGIAVAAVANDFLAFALSNPVGSNVLAVVERWDVNETSTFDANVTLTRDAAVQATVNKGVVRDIRAAGGGSVNCSVCSMSSGTPAAVTGTIIAKVVTEGGVGAGNLHYKIVRGDADSLVLLPGDVFAVFSATNPAGGVAGACGIWWKERPLESSETAA